MKPITKAVNKRRIIIYYFLALIFVGIGLFLQDPKWYAISAAFLVLAMVRKYFLHKRLKE